MPLLGGCDAPSLPGLKFGLSPWFSVLRSDCGATWQPAVQPSVGFFPRVRSAAGWQDALRGAGEPARPPGQTALAPAAPQWSVLPFSSPPPGLERGRACLKEACVGGEIGENTHSGPSEVSGRWATFFFQLPSAFQEVATNPLLFPINPLRLFCLIPDRVFAVPVSWVLGKCGVRDAVPGRALCFMLSLNHLRLEFGSGGWEGSTCAVLPSTGSHPGGAKLCLDGGFNSRWITSLLNTLGAEIFCCQFSGILQPEWLIPLSGRKAGDMYMIPLRLAIRGSWEIQSVPSVSNLPFFFSCF